MSYMILFSDEWHQMGFTFTSLYGDNEAMHSLRQYLTTLTPPQRAEYARRAGTTLRYLTKALSAGDRFGGVVSRRLDEASGGAVSKHELRPDIFGPPPSMCSICDLPVLAAGDLRCDSDVSTVSHFSTAVIPSEESSEPGEA